METIVTTKQGSLEGLLSEDKQTVIFRGVPYAQPPVGELRFRRPQEHAAWEGILPCRKFAPRCPQADLTKMDFYSKEFYDDMVPETNED
ncbi:carboxylesterase family protein, partial [Neglectibacter timonensis]